MNEITLNKNGTGFLANKDNNNDDISNKSVDFNFLWEDLNGNETTEKNSVENLILTDVI